MHPLKAKNSNIFWGGANIPIHTGAGKPHALVVGPLAARLASARFDMLFTPLWEHIGVEFSSKPISFLDEYSKSK